MGATGTVFMLLLGGVVMRAAFAVHMLMLLHGGVVMRAAGPMHMLRGTVVMIAGFSMLMLVSSFGRIHSGTGQRGNKA